MKLFIYSLIQGESCYEFIRTHLSLEDDKNNNIVVQIPIDIMNSLQIQIPIWASGNFKSEQQHTTQITKDDNVINSDFVVMETDENGRDYIPLKPYGDQVDLPIIEQPSEHERHHFLDDWKMKVIDKIWEG
jgi:hypothetical protein